MILQLSFVLKYLCQWYLRQNIPWIFILSPGIHSPCRGVCTWRPECQRCRGGPPRGSRWWTRCGSSDLFDIHRRCSGKGLPRHYRGNMPPLPPTNLKYFGEFDKYFYPVTKVNFLCDTCIINFGIIATLQRNLLRKIIMLPRIKSLGICLHSSWFFQSFLLVSLQASAYSYQYWFLL